MTKKAYKENKVNSLKNELTVWEKIKEEIDDGSYDQQTILDTLEGETDLFGLVGNLIDEIDEQLIMVDGLKARIQEMSGRKGRLEKTVDSIRTVILAVMDKAEIPKIVTDTATISVKQTPQKLLINNEAEIESKFFTKSDPVLNKKMIMSALKDEEDVIGASLTPKGITLQVRKS